MTQNINKNNNKRRNGMAEKQIVKDGARMAEQILTLRKHYGETLIPHIDKRTAWDKRCACLDEMCRDGIRFDDKAEAFRQYLKLSFHIHLLELVETGYTAETIIAKVNFEKCVRVSLRGNADYWGRKLVAAIRKSGARRLGKSEMNINGGNHGN